MASQAFQTETQSNQGQEEDLGRFITNVQEVQRLVNENFWRGVAICGKLWPIIPIAVICVASNPAPKTASEYIPPVPIVKTWDAPSPIELSESYQQFKVVSSPSRFLVEDVQPIVASASFEGEWTKDEKTWELNIVSQAVAYAKHIGIPL